MKFIANNMAIKTLSICLCNSFPSGSENVDKAFATGRCLFPILFNSLYLLIGLRDHRLIIVKFLFLLISSDGFYFSLLFLATLSLHIRL